ncbi:MAG: hypothetical protein R3E12_16970 [Candidatus Eisenbacteria bacterium]
MVQAAQPTSFPPIILGGPFVTGDARTLNHTAEFEDGVLGDRKP